MNQMNLIHLPTTNLAERQVTTDSVTGDPDLSPGLNEVEKLHQFVR